MARRTFIVGEPAPDFRSPASNNPTFNFNTAAGRYIVLCFYGSMSVAKNAQALAAITGELRDHFNDSKVSFFGISIDPNDHAQQRVREMIPGIRYFWDYDLKVSRLYGATSETSTAQGAISYHSFTLVLDPTMRVLANIPLADAESHKRILKDLLESLPPIDDHAGVPMNAPVLIVPRVLEPDLCRALIAYYEKHGGKETGTMIEKDGYTVEKFDSSFKKRKDEHILDPELRKAVDNAIGRKLLPEVHKAFQFKVTVIERHIVACYAADDGGFFRAHRDNKTRGTAHRRFACTINLNAEDYEGGDLRFPEFGSRTYRAPTGGAVVFSCSLLHEVSPVTQGKRYATLPFFYDDTAAKLREENLKFVSDQVLDLNNPPGAA